MATLPSPNSSWRRLGRAAGFTLVELLLASSLAAVALVGIYSLFRQVLNYEAVTSRSWADREAARLVASELAEAIERCVKLPGTPMMLGQRQGQVTVLECTVGPRLRPSADPVNVVSGRLRFTADLSREPGRRLEVERLVLAGSRVVDLAVTPAVPEDVWLHATSRPIAARVDELTVEYRSLGGEVPPWRDQWQDGENPPVVRIRVRIGECWAERVVVAAVNGASVPSSEGGAG